MFDDDDDDYEDHDNDDEEEDSDADEDSHYWFVYPIKRRLHLMNVKSERQNNETNLKLSYVSCK